MTKRYFFSGGRMEEARQHVQDELPEVVTPAEINARNRRYWEHAAAQRTEWPEKVTISELRDRGGVLPGQWRGSVDGERVGRLVALIPADAVALTLDGNRRYLVDGQIPRGRLVLALPCDQFVIEEAAGQYLIWDFSQASDPASDPYNIARFQAELAAAGRALSGHEDKRKVAATDHRIGDVERNRAYARRLAGHDWSGHGHGR